MHEQTLRNERISEFIDDLNAERKPKASHDPALWKDEELEQLLETVRVVRRLRGSLAEDLGRVDMKKEPETLHFFDLKKMAMAVCIIVIIFTCSGMVQLTKKPHNILYAMAEAYEQVKSISGVLEYRDETGSRVMHSEITKFKFESPNKFHAEHSFNNTTYTSFYDGGDVMYSEWTGDPERTRVDFMDPEMLKTQMSWLLLKNTVKDLINGNGVVEQKKIGGEIIAGRETDGYEIKFEIEGNVTIQRIWVDKKINLPLKWEILYPGKTTDTQKKIEDSKLVTCFKEIDINPEVSENLFKYTPAPSRKFYLNNPPLEFIKKQQAGRGETGGEEGLDPLVRSAYKAFDKMRSYRAAIMSYKQYKDIEIDVERTEMQYKGKDKLYRKQYTNNGKAFSEVYNGKAVKRITPEGEVLISENHEDTNSIAKEMLLLSEVDPVQLTGLKKTENTSISGRDASGYQYVNKSDGSRGMLWIDKATALPLKLEYDAGKLKIVKCIVDIGVNPPVDDRVFSVENQEYKSFK